MACDCPNLLPSSACCDSPRAKHFLGSLVHHLKHLFAKAAAAAANMKAPKQQEAKDEGEAHKNKQTKEEKV